MMPANPTHWKPRGAPFTACGIPTVQPYIFCYAEHAPRYVDCPACIRGMQEVQLAAHAVVAEYGRFDGQDLLETVDGPITNLRKALNI